MKTRRQGTRARRIKARRIKARRIRARRVLWQGRRRLIAVQPAPIESEAVEKAAHVPALQGMKRWPVAISYFEAGKKDDAPAYVLSFDLYENGISRALKLDYGDFVLAGEMTQLDILPSKTCAQ